METKSVGVGVQGRKVNRRRAKPERAVDVKNEMAKVIASVPALRRASYERAVTGKATASGAIRAKCQECVGFEDIPDRVGGCTTYRCPLWSYRPYAQPRPSEGVNQ